MTRGYLSVSSAGGWIACRATQGSLDSLDANSWKWGKAVERVLAKQNPSPGLYRLALNNYEGHMVVKLGAAVKNAVTEAARLRKAATEQALTARSTRPGIAGQQHMATMGTMRLKNVQRESLKLAEWLLSNGKES